MADNYIYIWASEVVREYEKAALTAGVKVKNRDLVMTQWKGPIQAMNMALDSAEFTLRRGLIPSRDGADDKEPATATVSSALSQDENTASTSGEWGKASVSGFDVFPKTSCSDKVKDRADEWAKAWIDPHKKAGGLGATWGGAEVKVDYLQKWLDSEGFKLPYSDREFSSPGAYAEECWSCLLKLDFDWQIQPVNLLSEIDRLLQQIEDLSDFMIGRADPTKALNWMCQFDWMEKLVCPTSLIALLTMLSMLLMKYQMDSFSISLDWTAIVGPIIKAIMDAIVGLIESILALARTPLDCLVGVLRTIDGVMKSGEKLGNSAVGLANYIGSDRNPIGGLVTQIAGNQSPDAFHYNVKEEKNLGKPDPATFSDVVPEWTPTQKEPKKHKAPLKQQKSDVTTGFTVAGNSILSEEVMKKPDFQGLDVAILALQESRQWIEELAKNLIVGLRSLGKMFGGHLGISIGKAGLIMLVMDLIALIKAIIQLSREGCPDGNPESKQSAFTQEDIVKAIGYMAINTGISVKSLDTIHSDTGYVTLEAGDGMFKQDIMITKCSPDVSKDMDKIFRDLAGHTTI